MIDVGNNKINQEIQYQFARRNMRIKSSHDTTRSTPMNYLQHPHLNKLNLDTTLVEIKQVYSPLSVTRYNKQLRESKMNSPFANSPSPRHYQEVPNSLMIQDSKNIELMNDMDIAKLSYLPKLHKSLNYRRMKMDQYSSPWEKIKKIAQLHNTPVLFEQHSIFGTSLTGFDGNIAIKPLCEMRQTQQNTDQSFRRKNESQNAEQNILKNEKIRLNMTLQDSAIRSVNTSLERDSRKKSINIDNYKDIQIEKEKKEKIKQQLDQNQQQYLQKFWTSKFNNKDKSSIEEQQKAKKKVYDRQLEGINRFNSSRQHTPIQDRQRCQSLVENYQINNQNTISIIQHLHNQVLLQQNSPIHNNNQSTTSQQQKQNLQLNLPNHLLLPNQQSRVSTPDQRTQLFSFQRKPQISPRKLEQLQNKSYLN